MLRVIRCTFSLLLLTVCGLSTAHEVRPAIADIEFLRGGEVVLNIETNLEALIAQIGVQHKETNQSPNAAKYDHLRGLSPEALLTEYGAFKLAFAVDLKLEVDGEKLSWTPLGAKIPPIGDTRLARISTLKFVGSLPVGASQAVFSMAPQHGNVAVKFRDQDTPAKAVHWLSGGKATPAYLIDEKLTLQPWYRLAFDYTKLGFEHIVPKGIDHILFVLGLFLLSLRLRPLLIQVTAFTVAHSITLGLSIYGVISLSPTIVEPLIALSIVYVGIENIVRGENSLFRVMVIFMFGLLHGLGFSSVLTDIGLPEADFLTALLTFNLGVELGQVTVIAGALLLLTMLGMRGHSNYRRWITVPGSAIISVVGLVWFLQRTNII